MIIKTAVTGGAEGGNLKINNIMNNATIEVIPEPNAPPLTKP
jgi:hypothetical protein